MATYSSKLEAAVPTSSVPDGEVSELQADLGTLFAHEVVAMRADEQKIFATTVEIPQAQHVDKIVGAPVVLQHQALTIQTEQKTPEVPLIQHRDRVVDVPVSALQSGQKTVGLHSPSTWKRS